MQNKIIETLTSWQAEMTKIRHEIHAWPELAFTETKTASKINQLLSSWGIKTHLGLGKTGVVGIIHGKHSGQAIGLRADIDALPITETNTFAHASKNIGNMHACGHDGHTTMLLAAAKYLAYNNDFNGTVYLIFQPAEESGGGAHHMIQDGLFQKFPMAAVFGMHNWPGIPVGQFALTKGPIMASSNIFTVTIKGRGAHGAMPHLGVDPVAVAAQLISAYQTIVARELDPLDAAVISVTQIQSGSANNVIPDTATMHGTVRTLSNKVLDYIESRMAKLSTNLCEALRCGVEFEFKREYPPTINHAKETDICAQTLEQLVGPENYIKDVKPSMGAEDFAFMLQEVPGCYIWIGNGEGDHRHAGHGAGPCTLHNSSYDFNDELIPLGASYWVSLVHRFLNN